MAGKSGRSGRRTNEEERKLEALLHKSYDYLCRMFTRFDEKTKIHIALTLIAKRVPTEVNMKSEEDVNITVTHESVQERLQQFFN